MYPLATARRASAHRPCPADGMGVVAVIAAVFASAALGGYFTNLSVRDWYPALAKPSWTPPDAVFGPVWGVLYVLIATAGSIAWLARDRTSPRKPLLALGVVLVLMVAWCAAFFGLRNPLLGFAVIAALCVATTTATAVFFEVSRTTGWLFVPVLLWVLFAAALNAGIFLLAV